MASSQKFIARNRAPRVQVEYEVEVYGAQKKIDLPFVMGVLSDLSGKAGEGLPAVADRKFLEIDVDNFDDRMRAVRPRVAFSVPNTLTGEGNLAVDIAFESMADFTPGAIAAKVEPLRQLLEARTDLANLLTYMDGKTGAEALLERVLADPTTLSALATDPPPPDTAGILATLRTAAPPPAAADDTTAADALAALKAAAPVEQPAPDTAGHDALASLKAAAPPPVADTTTTDALAALKAAAPAEQPTPDTAGHDALASLKAAAPPPVADTTTTDALAALKAAVPVEQPAPDTAGHDALASLKAAAPPPVADDTTTDALAALRAAAPAEQPALDTAGHDALASLKAAAPPPVADDTTKDALAALRAAAPAEQPTPDTAGHDALASLKAAAPPPVADDTTTDALAALKAAAPAEQPTPDSPGHDALAGLRAAAPPPAATDTTAADALAGLRAAAPPEAEPEGDAFAALAALRAAAPVEPQDGAAAVPISLRDIVPAAGPQGGDATAGALASLRAAGADGPVDDLGDPDDLPGDPLPLEGDGTKPIAPDVDWRDLLPATETAGPAVTLAAPDDPLGDLDALLGGPAPLEDEAPAPAAGAAVELRELVASAPRPDPLADLDALLGGPLPLAEEIAEARERPDDPAAGPEPEETAATPETGPDPLAALFGEQAEALPAAPVEPDPLAGLDALLGGDPVPVDDPLADLGALLDGPPAPDPLAGLDAPPGGEPAPAEPPADDPLAGLDALLGGPAEPAPEPAADPLADLLALLQPEPEPEPEAPEPAEDPLAGLMALLAEPTPDPAEVAAAGPAAGVDPLADLEALLGGAGGLDAGAVVTDDPPAGRTARRTEGETAMTDTVRHAGGASGFGTLTAPAPAPGTLDRPVFRMAILGDFSGRAARGKLETGDALARRRAIRLDIDSVEEVVEGFATTLVLPVGQDGQGIEVELGGLDDLHPDELADKVELFDELKGLRRRLANPGTAARALAEMQGWHSQFGLAVVPTRGRSGAASVPADRRITDFQRLIGDAEGRTAQPSAAADLIARVVGPHVVAAPNPEAKAAIAAVDEAMGAAMRLVLHHPEFQAIEAAWRSLDLIARQIETDEKLEITIFDISAEEFAADLGTSGDLAQTGIFRLLNEPLTVEGGVGYSAVFGLYTFEEIPPHADLLGRMGRIAAHLRAPFVAAMAPGFMEVAKRDRHPLVAAAWDGLRADPVAAWLGLTAPRFLMRRLYGKKTDPIDAFAFEEFTMAAGLSGMLWANPAVLVAVLLARAWSDGRGRSMDLTKVMSISDMPYHVVTDAHGDQIALPCTERNVTTDKAEAIVTRGFMPVVSVRGRDVVRLASFQSLAGRELAGRWGDMPAAPPAPAGRAADLTAVIPPAPAAGGLDAELDALLAGFGDTPAPADPGAIDADLAALLEGL